MMTTNTTEPLAGAELGSLALQHSTDGPRWTVRAGEHWRALTLAEAAALVPARRHELARRHLRALEDLMGDWLTEADDAVAARLHAHARRLAVELGEVAR